MSTYTVNEVCWRLVHDPLFREAIKSDPSTALEAEDLTDGEREAILTGDVASLHALGAHDFLLGILVRYQIGGLTVPLYNERIRGLPAYVPIY
jgi:hypothetical protein